MSYDELTDAIIIQAAKDYIALKKGTQTEETKIALKDIENFLLSDYGQALSGKLSLSVLEELKKL